MVHVLYECTYLTRTSSSSASTHAMRTHCVDSSSWQRTHFILHRKRIHVYMHGRVCMQCVDINLKWIMVNLYVTKRWRRWITTKCLCFVNAFEGFLHFDACYLFPTCSLYSSSSVHSFTQFHSPYTRVLRICIRKKKMHVTFATAPHFY